MTAAAPKSFWLLFLVVSLSCSESPALTIYRFGGESLPPPPELSAEGGGEVRFEQRQWTDLDPALGGGVYQLDLDDQWIRALEHDPQVNVAPGYEERGGNLGVRGREAFGDKYASAFDGDLATAWMTTRYLCSESVWECHEYARPEEFPIFLGGLFFIDRLRIVSGLSDPSATVRNIRIGIGETFEIRDNREQFRVVPVEYDQRVDYIRLTLGEHDRAWEVVEVEVYAKGFVDESSYVSDIFDFGGAASWGELRWSGFREPGAKLFIQTRSGADDDPDLYWQYTGRGNERTEVTRSQYDRLKLGQKAGTTYDLDNWTFWSAPYDFADSSGAAVVSSSPRRYLQFKVDMIPHNESGSGLEFLELRASTPPAASRLLGEIFPTEVEAGQPTRFTYAAKPTLTGDDTGFDRLRMTSFTSRILSVDSVRVDKGGVPFEVEALSEHSFEVSFPRLVREEDSGALIEVVFNAQVLRYGSSFDAWVLDSSRPLEVPQRIDAGDATDDFDGNTLFVATPVDDQSLLEISVSSRVLTPNGDGINDSALLSYELLESIGTVSMAIEIRDVAGRLVRQLYAGEDRIGHYDRRWDGTDDAGEHVPPGLYLFRASMDTDEGRIDRAGTICVAY